MYYTYREDSVFLSHDSALQIGAFPCGFCGRSGTCKTRLKKTKNAFRIESDCVYKSAFNIASAETPTQTGPSTNRPVVCKLCEVARPPQRNTSGEIDIDIVFWTYNMHCHVEEKHDGVELSEDFADSYRFGSRNEHIFLKLEKGKPEANPKKRRAQDTGGEGTSSKKARKS